MIPERFHHLFSTPAGSIHGTPAVIFRDHRLTAPAILFAAEAGLLRLPAVLVTLDRHRDSLVPESALEDIVRWRSGNGTADEFARIAVNSLSSRNDDWIVACMEVGLVSDAVQFRSERDNLEPVTRHVDHTGGMHRIFHLGLPGEELAFRGALADPAHPAAAEGLWNILRCDPREGASGLHKGGLVLDIDLDFFTAPYETYILPFTVEIWRGEFFSPRSSDWSDSRIPAHTIREFARTAGVVTIACEPGFCGGSRNARRILAAANRHLFGCGIGIQDCARILFSPADRNAI